MINSQVSHGMVPSDILVRGAIQAALDDLRRNPFLLDYVFMWYANDDLTKNEYGESERSRAKKWFLQTEIAVSMNYRADDVKFPLISIGLQSSTEDQSTLGDVNYETTEDVPANEIVSSPQILVGPFTPKSYVSATGIITLPDNLTTENIFENTILVDVSTNTGFPIRDIIDGSSFAIDEDSEGNFTRCYVAPIDNFYTASFESCLFKQTFSIKIFAQAQPVHVLYLQSIVEFILLRYKQELLEARGFERSTISLGPLAEWKETDKDTVYFRDVSLVGFVRQYWPKLISQKIQGIKIHGIEIIGGTSTPPGFLNLVEAQGWGMPGDFDDIDGIGAV